ncbi:MAG: hypothetical protein IPO65_15755 [Saprospiraceae bacterium]|nr:hypothetical protein [Saprospiraceae bacterium]
MKVHNLHTRIIPQPRHTLGLLMATLATKKYQMLATDKWPRMRLDKGLVPGSRGGHGPIRYFVAEYNEGESITFTFDMKGFNGFHKFELIELDDERTRLRHIIDMKTSGWATIKWALAIRWLHDAFIEDAFDRVEGHFNPNIKQAEWSWWVKAMRWALSQLK